MAADVAMEDIDFEDAEIARLQAAAAAITTDAPQAMNTAEEVREEGEFDENEVQPTKVHVEGVNKLNTDQIKSWVVEHVGNDLFRKVEWIDDNSANLIFDTEVAAIDALNILSAIECDEPLDLRDAKDFSGDPDVALQVRQTLVSDVKAAGAKDRSAFYLFNPEWDPDNPDNVRNANRKRRWADDGGRERNKYRRREWGDDRYQRRGSRDQGEFTEDMYDEAPATASAPPENRRPSRASSGEDYARRKITFDDDVFAPKQNGRLRDRSASPGREGDGRYGFSEDQPQRRTARPRSATPPRVRKNRENRSAHESAVKELLPDKPKTAFSNGYGHYSDRPNTPPSSTGPRELFPDMQGTPNHRRNDGRDLPLEQVVHFMGESNLEGRDGRAYGSRYGGDRPSSSRSNTRNRDNNGARGDLFARSSGATEGRGSGRLSRERDDDDTGVSIRGEAQRNGARGGGDQGFSIPGASKQNEPRAASKLPTELFPIKNGGGVQKDLFDGRIKGRARPRAADLFDS